MYGTLPVLIFRRKSKWQKTWHVSVVVGVIGTKVQQQPQPRMAKTVTHDHHHHHHHHHPSSHRSKAWKCSSLRLCCFSCSQGGGNYTSACDRNRGKKVIPSSLLHFLSLEGGGVAAAPLSSLTSLSV